MATSETDNNEKEVARTAAEFLSRRAGHAPLDDDFEADTLSANRLLTGVDIGADVSVAEHYSYQVTWSPEDQEFVGTVPELPSLSWLEPDAGAALACIQRLARDLVAELLAAGETVPPPLCGAAR